MAEFEFRQITLQVLLAAMNVSTAHSAFERSEKVFDVVRGVSILVQRIPMAPMQQGLMRGKLFAKPCGCKALSFIANEALICGSRS